MNFKVHYPILCGLCAAAASVFGKLCGLPTFQDYLLFRITFFGLMIACNAGVCTLFVKALHSTDSSLTATVVSSASNYLITGFTGFLVFGEATSWLWWIGILTVMAGLTLILNDQMKTTKTA